MRNQMRKNKPTCIRQLKGTVIATAVGFLALLCLVTIVFITCAFWYFAKNAMVLIGADHATADIVACIITGFAVAAGVVGYSVYEETEQ